MSRRTIVKLEIAFLLAIPAWVILLGCAGEHADAFSMKYMFSYYYLVTGWAFFLGRVLPNVTVNWSSVGMTAGCLLGLAFGMHIFCVWLHREIARKKALQKLGPDEQLPPLPIWRFRTTLCILGIVILMFVAGIAAVGAVHQLIWLRTRS